MRRVLAMCALLAAAGCGESEKPKAKGPDQGGEAAPKSRGTLVFADLVWSAPPPRSFLEFLGVEEMLYWPAEQAAGILAREGLEPGAELRASPAAWDDYERAILAGRLAAADSLDAEDGNALRERAHRWFREYEAHGRHCLGFAAYVAVRRH